MDATWLASRAQENRDVRVLDDRPRRRGAPPAPLRLLAAGGRAARRPEDPLRPRRAPPADRRRSAPPADRRRSAGVRPLAGRARPPQRVSALSGPTGPPPGPSGRPHGVTVWT